MDEKEWLLDRQICHAFSGQQRENICYIGGDVAYEWYVDVFNSLKDNSVDEISHKALVISDLEENINELPISQTIKTNKALVIESIKDNFI